MAERIKIVVDENRRLVQIERPDFRLDINGRDNYTYLQILALLEVDLVFETPVTEEAKARRGAGKQKGTES